MTTQPPVESAAPSPESGMQSALDEAAVTPETFLPGEGALIELPEDRRLADQREKTVAVLDKAVLVLALVAAVSLILALVQTVRGSASLAGWLTPFVTGAIAVGGYALLQRIGQTPAKTTEVPASLGPRFFDAIEDRAAVLEEGDRFLEDEEYLEVAQALDELFKDAVISAELSLETERSGQQAEAKRHAVEARAHLDTISQIHEDVFSMVDEEVDDDEPEYVDEPPSIVRPELETPPLPSSEVSEEVQTSPSRPGNVYRGTVYRPK